MFLFGHLRLALAGLLFLLGGCAGKHVTFFPQTVGADVPEETRIFLDARGHLYPKTGLDDGELRGNHEGSLFQAAFDRRSSLCGSAAAGTEMAMLCAAISRKACRGWACLPLWEDAQQRLWQRRGQEIAAASAAEGATMLVFIIHGFNNWYGESQPNYREAEKQLRLVAPSGQRIRFVEIYWDGCRGLDIGVGCWGRAQYTGPLAGFSLRQLLNAIDQAWPTSGPRPAMRILTHSSGAFVAGAIVGSPFVALPLLKNPKKDARYSLFRDYRSASSGPYRIPQPHDLKIAMLAAATPYTTYAGASGTDGAMVRNLGLLVSVHPKDSAITKMGLIGCRRFGASCLGAKRKDLCLLKRALEGNGKGMSVTGYDFARDERIWGKRADLHAFQVYIEQASHHSTFFRDFMALGTPMRRTGAEGRPIACT